MRKLWLVAALGFLGLAVHPSWAVDARFPTKALNFTTWMVRAFNQCTPSGLTVITSNLPSTGCPAVVSDDIPPGDPLGATMQNAKLQVRRFPGYTGGDGRIKVTGKGFQAGQRIKVRLTFRTTRSQVATKHPPSTNNSVTFSDTTIECGVGPGNCFVARSSGVLVGTQTLSACLTQNGQGTGLARENVQIIAASLVNCDTGDTVAVPGILN
jgi:hypothetical protein